MQVLYIALLYLSGSLMFSHWIGLMLHKDLRQLNDGNPGASNLWQSAGAGWGLLGVFLDFMKGYMPLALLIWGGAVQGYLLVPAAAAPIVAHAYSPFMRFKGGKSKAVSFGVWSALTNFEASVVLAVIMAVLQLIVSLFHIGKNNKRRVDAWTSVLGLLLLGGYLVVWLFSIQLILIWCVNLMIFVVTNRVCLLETLNRSPEEREDSRI